MDEPLEPRLVTAFLSLPPDQRDVVVLRLVFQLPLEEVAYMTGRSEEAVESLEYDGMATLTRRLDNG
ncbi:MAG: Sigma-70, region 4 [Acidimicrobiaceae bacterium]